MFSSAEGEAAVSLSSSGTSLPANVPLTIDVFDHDHDHDLKALLFWLEVQNNVNRGEIRWKR